MKYQNHMIDIHIKEYSNITTNNDNKDSLLLKKSRVRCLTLSASPLLVTTPILPSSALSI